MNFDPSLTLVIISACSGIFAAAATVIGGFFKASHWLNERFENLRVSLECMLNKHEGKDQERHEENIERFAKIETQLVTILKNGNGTH